MENQIISCLRSEVKPATGCTEPVAIALAAAFAARSIENPCEIDAISIVVSTNILKNAMNVGVPRTKRVGLEIAAVLGAFGDAENGMNVLSALDDVKVLDAHRAHQVIPIQVSRFEGTERIFIDVTLHVKGIKHRAVVEKRHDQLKYYSVDDVIYFQDESSVQSVTADYVALFEQNIETILKTIDQMDASSIDFMMDGYHMNKDMAIYGLEHGPGLGLGRALKLNSSENIDPSQLITYAMQMTAAASDARMAGADMPVMTSNGSGNNGLTAVLPIVAADIIYNFDKDRVIKALAMSHIINSYIKYYLGRLSSVCACGVASATGSAIGIGYLLDIHIEKLPHIIDTMVANLSGMTCDGAKLGCALKLSTATAAAIQSVYLLKHNSYADMKNGIVGRSPEESIQNLAKLANIGMQPADHVITDILMSKI
jgi:L-cysteine desulfidase